MGAGASSINGKPIISLDCEMVQSTEYNNILARVSIVDYDGNVLFNTYVSPHPHQVLDYLTEFSGIRPENLRGAPSFSNVQRRVQEIIASKIIVGHSLHNDFRALQLSVPIENKRDIGKSRFIINKYGNNMGQAPSLKRLANLILNRNIQVNGHDSIEDAKAALDIYKHYQEEFEKEEAVLGGRIEMQVEQEGYGAGTFVAAGCAAVAAIGAISYLTRNNRD